MAISNPFSSSSSAGADSSAVASSEMKTAIMTQLQSESAMSNARALMTKLQENCFEKCVPSPPGSSLGTKEHTCLNMCMEKYISLWNTISRSYITRVGREQRAAGLADGGLGS